MGNKLEDLTGQRFGRLTVLKKDLSYTRHKKWICQCDCGEIKSIFGSGLKRGTSTSCGCYQRSYKSIENKYVIKDETVYLYLRDSVIIFDKSDYDLVSKQVWSISKDKRVKTRFDNKNVEFYQLLFYPPPEGMEIDHINRNRLDNRRKNLRICFPQENYCNRSVGKNNTSGKVGVIYCKKGNYWFSNIYYKNKKIGKYFKTYIEAYEYRLFLEQVYFKEFSASKIRRE